MKKIKRFCKKNYLIITILVLAIILRIIFLDLSYVFWDESIYLMGAKTLVGQPAGYNELDFRHPLLPILIIPFTFFSQYVLLSKIFMIFLNSILVVVIYLFGKQFNKSIGLLSAFFASILPYHLMSSSWVMTDGLAAILLLLTIIFYFKGLKQNKNFLICLGGFFFSLSILMKFPNLILLIILPPLFLLNLKKIKTILKSLIIALLTFSPYLIINYIIFGNPIHGFMKAFLIGNEIIETVGYQPIELIIKVFYDYFGLVLSIFIFAGLLLFIKKEVILKNNKAAKKENLFWVYCFFVFLPYYIYIIHEGTTPIWWDTQRFLLSFLPFGLLFSSYFIIRILNNFSKKAKTIILAALIILILLSWNQQYIRFAQPAIEHEEGLRHVTKELGLYLKGENIDNLLCLGNCPPIAYYSNKKIAIIYDVKNFELEPDQYGVIFSDNIKRLKSYNAVKTFCEQEWCAFLIKNA